MATMGTIERRRKWARACVHLIPRRDCFECFTPEQREREQERLVARWWASRLFAVRLPPITDAFGQRLRALRVRNPHRWNAEEARKAARKRWDRRAVV